jgi:PAS domain-containing protein
MERTCLQTPANPGRVQNDVTNARASIGDAILASASDAIIATDRDGIVNFWNPGATRISALRPTKLLGNRLI